MKVIHNTNVSLVLEGGTFRTIYSGGVLDCMLDAEIMMPYIVAISAGAINASSYVSEQKKRSLRVMAKYRHDKRYMGWRNFLSEKSYFGLNFAYNTIPNEIDLFDWQKFRAFEGTIEFGVTNALTGAVEYMNALEMDNECTMLRATCAIPVMFPEIKMNDIPYYDGGLAEPVPIQHAIDLGYDKHVLVLTRPKGYRKKMDRQSKMVMQLLGKKYPKLREAMAHRVEHYNQSMELCERLEAEGKAFIFRPPYAMNSFEKDTHQMVVNYEAGYTLAKERMLELRQFLQS